MVYGKSKRPFKGTLISFKENFPSIFICCESKLTRRKYTPIADDSSIFIMYIY